MTQQAKGASAQNKVNLLTELAHNARLVWRLFNDPRVATTTKLILPGLAAAYLLWPADLMPDILPALGQLDDLAIIALAVKLFVDLCPSDIVRQHREGSMQGPAPQSRDQGKGDVVDAEYRVVE